MLRRRLLRDLHNIVISHHRRSSDLQLYHRSPAECFHDVCCAQSVPYQAHLASEKLGEQRLVMRLPVKPSDANAHSEQSGFLASAASERVKGPFPVGLHRRSVLSLERDLVWMGSPYTCRPSLFHSIT